jgi:hypothetical protein
MVLKSPFTIVLNFLKKDGRFKMKRKYTFTDNFVTEVDGYLSPEQIQKFEKEHGLLFSVTTGNQEVLCGHARKI